MNHNVVGKCTTNIDNISLSHITGFTCKPDIGDIVSVIKDGKPFNLEVCRVSHVYEKTHNGYVSVLEVELTLPKRDIL